MGIEAHWMEKLDGAPPAWRSLLSNLLECQRGILRSKSHAIADCMLDVDLSAHIGDVVQIALGIGFGQVNRRGHQPMFHGNQSGGNARGAACALSMSNLRFQSRHRNAMSVIP